MFLNDLFYFITRVKLNAYPDDQQLYSSDGDHLALYNRLHDELSVAVDWFKHKGLMPMHSWQIPANDSLYYYSTR